MPKTTASEIKDLGFNPQMFRKEDNTFDAYLDDVITEKSVILQGRIGSTTYASSTSPTKDYVKRAEKCLVAAELLQRRINFMLGNVEGEEGSDLAKARQSKKEYLEEAEALIVKIVAGITTDNDNFTSGVLETSHFESSS